MTDTYDYADQPDDSNEAGFLKQLRADARAKKDAEAAAASAAAEVAAMKRELALTRAGVDTSTPLGQMFAKAWDGEPDVDAIRGEWAKVTGTAPAPDADQAAMARIQQTLSGAAPGGSAPIDFEAELDSIPMVVDGAMNPNYVQQVLTKTAEQAAREGREFNVSGAGAARWNTPGSQPATTPLR